jgi:DNA transposition AAA+ family ATPase
VERIDIAIDRNSDRRCLPRFSVQLLLGPQVQELLAQRWAPAGFKLPEGPLSPEVVASLIRMTGGNFRLLTRLLTQIERVLSVNNLHHVSVEVVEAARDSLVIGTN